MPTEGSARRVLSLRLGISSIFDLTGAAIFRLVRPTLPDPPPAGSRPDPFSAAMDTIMAAHREVVGRARDQREVTMQKPPDPSEVVMQTPDTTGVTLPA
jgi:hypothetical protein